MAENEPKSHLQPIGPTGGLRHRVQTLTYFVVNYAVCGRPLRESVELLGSRVTCQQCGCEFIAYDPESLQRQETSSNVSRANELLGEAMTRGKAS